MQETQYLILAYSTYYCGLKSCQEITGQPLVEVLQAVHNGPGY